jgi:hypothetical protein
VLNKTMIALTAAVAFGSSAVAYEDPENRLGDRYPFLEQKYSAERSAPAMRYAQPRYVGLNQYSSEAPENKISDRYPLLEQATQPVASARVASPYVAQRQAVAERVGYTYMNEAPENKIGDRYPWLEPTYASQRVTPRLSTAGRSRSATRG